MATLSHGCKGFFSPFAAMNDGCKEVNFMVFLHEFGLLDTLALKVSQKTLNLLENSIKFTSLQPSVMVVKGKLSLATVTHGCKAVKVIIDEIRLTYEN